MRLEATGIDVQEDIYGYNLQRKFKESNLKGRARLWFDAVLGAGPPPAVNS